MSETDPKPNNNTLTIANLEIEEENSSQDNVTLNNDEKDKNIPDKQESDSLTSPGSPSLIADDSTCNTNEEKQTKPLHVSIEEDKEKSKSSSDTTPLKIDNTVQNKSRPEQRGAEKPNDKNITTNQDNRAQSLNVSNRQEDMSVDESPCNTEKKEDTTEPIKSVKNAEESKPAAKVIAQSVLKTPINNKSLETSNSCKVITEQKKVNVAPITNASLLNSSAKIDNESIAKKRQFSVFHLHTLKLFGVEYQMGLKEAKKYFMDKLNEAALPPVVFANKDKEKAEKCKTIYTCNWPTWITPEVIKLVARWFTDINFDIVNYFIEVLTYKEVTKGMGAALIHFDKAEDCMKYFQQLKNITWFNKNVKVELDLDNKRKDALIGQYVYCTLATGKPIAEDRWLDPKVTLPNRCRISLTSSEAPLDYRADPFPLDRPRLSFTDEQQRLDMLVILRVLGLPFAAVDKIKGIIKEKTANQEISVPKANYNPGIVISNVASWFQDIHFIYLLEIFLTETDLTKTPFFVEILQFSNGVNKGAALVRFANPAECLIVYKQLKRIELLNTSCNKKKSIGVNLDTGGKVANEIKSSPSLANWKDMRTSRVFCSRYVLTSEDMPPTHTPDKPPRLQLLKKKLSEKTAKNQEVNANAAKKPKLAGPVVTATASAANKPELSLPINSAAKKPVPCQPIVSGAAKKPEPSQMIVSAASCAAKRPEPSQPVISAATCAAKKPKPSQPIISAAANAATKPETSQPIISAAATKKPEISKPIMDVDASAAKKSKLPEPDNTVPTIAAKKPKLSVPDDTAPRTTPSVAGQKNLVTETKTNQTPSKIDIEIENATQTSQDVDMETNTKETEVVTKETISTKESEVIAKQTAGTNVAETIAKPSDSTTATQIATIKESKELAKQSLLTKKTEEITQQTEEPKEIAKPLVSTKESEKNAKPTVSATEPEEIIEQTESTKESEEIAKESAKQTIEPKEIGKQLAITDISEEITEQSASTEESVGIIEQTESTNKYRPIAKETASTKESEKNLKQTLSSKKSEDLTKQTASTKESGKQIVKEAASGKPSEEKATGTAKTKESEKNVKQTLSSKKSEEIHKQPVSTNESEELAKKTASTKESEEKAKQTASTKESEKNVKQTASTNKSEETAKQTAITKESEQIAKETTGTKESVKTIKETGSTKASEEIAKETANTTESEEIAKKTAKTKESEEKAKETASTKDSEELAKQTESTKESEEMDTDTDFIKDEDLVDVSEDDEEANTSKTTPAKTTDATNDATSLQTSQRKDMRVVHLKNLVPVANVSVVKCLLREYTNFNVDFKTFFIRKLRDEDNSILNECLLKFDNPADALKIATSVDGLQWRGKDVWAELKPATYAPKIVYLKRKPDDIVKTEDLPLLKIAMFEDEWEVIDPKRGFLPGALKTEETFGVNPAILARLGVKKLISPLIMVTNIHEEVSDAKLHEVFSIAGHITHLKTILKFSNKRARIEYEHPVEALQAVSMFNGQKLYGLPMRVVVCTDNNHKTLPAGLEGIGKGFGPKGLPLTAIQTHVFTRKLFEIFQRMGYVDKIRDDFHPFQGYFEVKPPHLLPHPPPFHNQQRNNWSGGKPSVATAIEALGTVLLALDLVPPDTDVKNLQSIIYALQQHPKVKQHLTAKNRNNAPQNQTSNQGQNQTDQNNQAEVFYQTLCTYMQNMGYTGNFPQMSQFYMGDNSGQNAFNMFSNYSNMNTVQQNQSMPSQSAAMNVNVQPAAVGVANYGVAVQGMAAANVQNAGYVYANMNASVATPSVPAQSVATPTIQRAPVLAGVSNTTTNIHSPNQNQAKKTAVEAPSPPKWNDSVNNSQRNSSQSTQSSSAKRSSKTGTRSRYEEEDSRHSSSKSKDRDSFNSDMLQFKNLPPSVTQKVLTRKMEEVGETVFAEMTGNGRALVRFKKVEDAARCHRLFHHSKVDGHVVDVAPV